jgi:hypothetical protein
MTAYVDFVTEGGRSLKSGALLDIQNQSSGIEYTDDFSAGTLSFDYRVSSQQNADFLYFYIDNVQQNRWSGEVPWTSFKATLPAGRHNFRWLYQKDASGAAGGDAAWIDNVVLPSLAGANAKVNTTTVITGLTPDPTTVDQGVTVSFAVTPSAPSANSPSGYVTVSDGTDSCVATVSAGNCVLTPRGRGYKSLYADYYGDWTGSIASSRPIAPTSCGYRTSRTSRLGKAGNTCPL